ncbi:hypothetical protein [Crocinitomix catalasitica]|uniref:hypothetical protein n=1 Tax=Crocinitomix catalasitica TaxID=184607 RepID=UPI000486B6C0|nr:hypothetical protein [Crocinitomix catalasitica]
MDDFDDLKQLWNTHDSVDIPNLEQMQTVIAKYQKTKKRNAFLATTLFIFCGLAFIAIILLQKQTFWTTIFGEMMILSGFVSGIILKLNSLKNITNHQLKPNKDYLQDLSNTTHRKMKHASWHLILSVLLLVIGYGFFIYEKLQANQTTLILSYIGIGLFTLGLYFIFRPLVNKISHNKIEKMIKEIEDLK